MRNASAVYLGIKGTVLALDRASGMALWQTQLKGRDFVNIAWDDNRLYAATQGEIFCIDPENGTVLWHNPLTGYGLGIVSIAGPGISTSAAPPIVEKRRRDAQAANSAGAAASSS
jgi:outer membrane protein assembly factor BamB